VSLRLALVVWLCAACDTPAADAPAELATLQGAAYLPARSITQTYCGPCHSKAGQDPEQERAYEGFKLDSYGQLKARQLLMLNALTIHGPRADMPPARTKLQPSVAER
jgi:hypothetical protein